MLKDLAIKAVYKSDQDNILEDFYFPALSVASEYDRAVGFFSASTLSYAAQALSRFIIGGGKIRLILGAFSDQRDIEAVNRGLNLKDISEKIGAQFLEQLGEVSDELFNHRFKALAWLVAHDRLAIKVALRPNGMYHDKIGIITDSSGDALIFSGSANESAHALLPVHNYESIDVFPSWKPELEVYFTPHRESFERLWENRSRGTAVMDVPTAVKEKLLEVAASLEFPPDPEREAAIASRIGSSELSSTSNDTGPRLPESINGVRFEIKQHQRDALNAWRVKGAFHGVLDLATGTGKTITAAYAIVQMAKSVLGLTVVISVPYQNLADQWCEVLAEFNIRAIRCYVSQISWYDKLQLSIHDIEMGAAKFACIVVVNRTLKSTTFQQVIARIPKEKFLWIGDECHHHSSESYSEALPLNTGYRLGLSATPQHYLDSDRNARLEQYYGQIVFTYSLKQAIEDKILSNYYYYPCLVELTNNESEVFVKMSDDIARAFGREDKKSKVSMGLTALLMRRARLIASASNKIPALIKLLENKRPSPHSLFYCGDGQVESQEFGEGDEEDDLFSGRQIEVVSQHLDALGWRVSRFTSREPRKERESILANFKMGIIDAMVAIKCLDEGIDVPACSTAFILASSRDPRQFIQRRGRILRRAPGKTTATIYDFVVVMAPSAVDESGHARKLIQSELQRVAEFSRLASNRSEAYERLQDVLKRYDLEHAI